MAKIRGHKEIAMKNIFHLLHFILAISRNFRAIYPFRLAIKKIYSQLMEFMCGFIQLSANQINIIIEFAYEIQSANSNLLNFVWLCAKRHIEQFNFLNFILCRDIECVEFNASLKGFAFEIFGHLSSYNVWMKELNANGPRRFFPPHRQWHWCDLCRRQLIQWKKSIRHQLGHWLFSE